MSPNFIKWHSHQGSCSTSGKGLVEYALLVSLLTIGVVAGLSSMSASLNTNVSRPGVLIIAGNMGNATAAPSFIKTVDGGGNSDSVSREMQLVFGWNGKVETSGDVRHGSSPDYPRIRP
jgi:hypothetical protein